MTQQERNPFSAPVQPARQSSESLVVDSVIDFGMLAKKWERYRLIYNGVLVAWTMLVAVLFFGWNVHADAIAFSFFGAIVCNLLFFLGPAADGYCQWIFASRSDSFGIAILTVGIMFTAAMVFGSFADRSWASL